MIVTKNKKAFSIIEMVAASMLLSLAVVSLCTVGAKAIRGVKSNRQYEQAWQMLDRQLAMIDYVGIGPFMELGQFEGQLNKDEDTGIVHRWNVVIEEGSYMGLYRVDMTLSWGTEKKVRSINASTYLYDDAAVETVLDENVTQ
ncbi:MAG: hypothetical protein KAS23_04340 [Anaerohalosphaera sp.]|nr:hypothetical protein [Anaerohalosphaera sp.]